MSDELQTELAELQVKHAALILSFDDLQSRYDQMVPLLLETREKLDAALANAKAAQEGKRVALKGFERQQRMHAEMVARVKKLGGMQSGPSKEPTDGPTPETPTP